MDQALGRAVAGVEEMLAGREGPLTDEEWQRIRELVIQVVTTNEFDLCGAAVRVSERAMKLHPALEGDLALQRALAFAAWIAGDRAASIGASKRALRFDPANPQIYTMLAWANLTAGNAMDAFLALGAGLAAVPGNEGLKTWHRLAELMMRGVENVRFDLDGRSYLFQLSTFSGQAMETSVHHAHGTFIEIEELRFLRDAVVTAPVIVEVGTLVGNHTVFFARNLAPRKIVCFDLDPRSIEETTRNFRLNVPLSELPELVAINKAVGASCQPIEAGGRTVEMTTLSAEVKEPVDFLKVDVDGMELEVLQGARALFAPRRLRAMIEVAHSNAPAFARFLEEVGYTVEREFKRPVDSNLYIVPRA